MTSKTIVTACDRNFIWGCCLLLFSLRRNGVSLPVHIVTYGLDEVQKSVLQQVDGVRLFEASDEAGLRHILFQKASAILTADSDLVMWVDADCMVTGDITPLIAAPQHGLQIRVRPEQEIAYLFRRRYAKGEPRGSLPSRVLERWREDVGERENPALNSSCNAHCFVVHRDRLGFIRQWDRQIRTVIPDGCRVGVVDDRSFAYFLLDEAVLSSLLIFAENPPPLEEYRLGRDPVRRVIHFGGTPKPWNRWLLRNLKYFDEVCGLLDWAESRGWELPGRPWCLKGKHKAFCYVLAVWQEIMRSLLRSVRVLKKRKYFDYG